MNYLKNEDPRTRAARSDFLGQLLIGGLNHVIVHLAFEYLEHGRLSIAFVNPLSGSPFQTFFDAEFPVPVITVFSSTARAST